jgi:hypothetical protein
MADAMYTLTLKLERVDNSQLPRSLMLYTGVGELEYLRPAPLA